MAEPFGGAAPFAPEIVDRAIKLRSTLDIAKVVWRFWPVPIAAKNAQPPCSR